MPTSRNTNRPLVPCCSCLDFNRLDLRHSPIRPHLETPDGEPNQGFRHRPARSWLLVRPLCFTPGSPSYSLTAVSASIAPIVRLKYLLLLNDSTKFLQGLSIILAWAQAEVGIGMLVANLPACRPLLERALSRLTSFTGSKNKSSKDPAASGAVKNSYLELGERDPTKKGTANASRSGVETRVYGRDMDGNSSESLPDDHSQKQIVNKGGLGAIRVQREFGMEVEKKRGGNSMV